MTADDQPSLRMAPRESAEDLARRLERERRAAETQREFGDHTSLAPFRVGSVPYLNGVPLTRGIEDEVLFAPPARLAELLREDKLDAALVSVTEALLNDRYDVLDEIAIASLGEVRSVLLAHRGPLESVRAVHCDPASLTSVNLLKVLLAERGLSAEFVPLRDYAEAPAQDAVLLIGDEAIRFSRASHPHTLWDLGTAWYELTNLPFVYAIWALQRGRDTLRLRRALREARQFGLDTLDSIIRNGEEFDLAFRKDYLGWHIHFHLGPDEKRGIERFMELLEKHGWGPVYPLRFVH
jgi:chorismate dehydratase